MDVYKLKDLSAEDRQTVLLGEAVSAEEQSYMKTLTPEELSIKREEMSNASILLNKLEEDFKVVKEAHKDEIKPIATARKNALDAIRLRAIQVTGKVWMIADHENKMMHSVTDDGNVLGSRPMLPEERQFRIPNILNKAI